MARWELKRFLISWLSRLFDGTRVGIANPQYILSHTDAIAACTGREK
jgi:hypothetical protein